jgi:hypothetical protein
MNLLLISIIVGLLSILGVVAYYYKESISKWLSKHWKKVFAIAAGGLVIGGGSVLMNNPPPGDDTGYNSPSAYEDTTWQNPVNAYSSNDSYASGFDDARRYAQYKDFGFTDIFGFISDINVSFEGKSGAGAPATVDAKLSWDGGSSWTSTQQITEDSGSDNTQYLDGTWGRTWSGSEFSNAYFRINLTVGGSRSGYDLDHLQIKVTYTYGDTLVQHKPDSSEGDDWANLGDAYDTGSDYLRTAAMTMETDSWAYFNFSSTLDCADEVHFYASRTGDADVNMDIDAYDVDTSHWTSIIADTDYEKNT